MGDLISESVARRQLIDGEDTLLRRQISEAVNKAKLGVTRSYAESSVSEMTTPVNPGDVRFYAGGQKGWSLRLPCAWQAWFLWLENVDLVVDISIDDIPTIRDRISIQPVRIIDQAAELSGSGKQTILLMRFEVLAIDGDITYSIEAHTSLKEFVRERNEEILGFIDFMSGPS
jgi:hypothetical protein